MYLFKIEKNINTFFWLINFCVWYYNNENYHTYNYAYNDNISISIIDIVDVVVVDVVVVDIVSIVAVADWWSFKW